MMAEYDSQSATSKWSEELSNTFPSIAGKTEAGLQVVKDISEFYRARAKIEDAYAKQLAALYKSAPGAGFFTKEPAITKEYRTLRESLLAILEKGTKISDSHQEFANKINTDVCKSLDNWVKNKTNDRTKIVADGQKYLQNVSAAKANVAKAKAEYERLMKETDSAKEKLIKAEKDELNQPENKKLPPITKKASQTWIQSKEKAKSLEASYQAAVKKANEELEAFRSERMPAIVENLQKWEEDRWNTLLASVKALKLAQESVPVLLEQHNKDLMTNYEAANIEEDFREFIETNKKPDIDETFEFVPFKSKYEEEEEEKKSTPVEERKQETKPAPVEEKKQEKIIEPKSEEQVKQEEAKKDADKKKTQELKANLFGDSDTSSDIFK